MEDLKELLITTLYPPKWKKLHFSSATGSQEKGTRSGSAQLQPVLFGVILYLLMWGLWECLHGHI